MIDWEKIPQKQYADGSIGHYMCHCLWCGDEYMGHKRDPHCTVCDQNFCAVTSKIPNERMERVFSQHPYNKLKIGFTCSAFDLLHAGHILMLKDGKMQCEYFTVGLQIDPSIDRPEKNQPVQSLEERFFMLSSIKYVDSIWVYETDADLKRLIGTMQPDIRILGSDWKEKQDEIIGFDLAPIHWHERDHDYSTSNLRRRVFEAERNKYDS